MDDGRQTENVKTAVAHGIITIDEAFRTLRAIREEDHEIIEELFIKRTDGHRNGAPKRP